CLAGCALGLALGWGAAPAAALGPARAWEYHRRWAEVVVLPGLGLGPDRSRESDLTGMARVNNQSLGGVLHSVQHPDRDGGAGRGLACLLLANLAANGLTSVPGLGPARDFGLATAAGVVLWAAGATALWRARGPSSRRRPGWTAGSGTDAERERAGWWS